MDKEDNKIFICNNCGEGVEDYNLYHSRITGKTTIICPSCRDKIYSSFITKWVYKIFGEWLYE